jgi:hypothetical protein
VYYLLIHRDAERFGKASVPFEGGHRTAGTDGLFREGIEFECTHSRPRETDQFLENLCDDTAGDAHLIDFALRF